MAVPPLRALAPPASTSPSSSPGPTSAGAGGAASSPSPVKAAALELGLPVTDRVDDVLDAGADLGVVVAYGRIIKPPVLEQVPMVNLHFSLLPRWRGAAPVERALLAGDAETGVCLMELEEGLDTGARLRAGARCRSGPTDDRRRAAGRAGRDGHAPAGRQPRAGLGHAHAPGRRAHLRRQDRARPSSRLDWSRPAAELDRLVRLGGAWTTFRGKRLKVLAAEPGPTACRRRPGRDRRRPRGTGDGALRARRGAARGQGSPRPWRPGATAPGPRPASALGR